MAEKFKHFKEDHTVLDVLEEIRGRLNYKELVGTICTQLENYFNEQFCGEVPSRFMTPPEVNWNWNYKLHAKDIIGPKFLIGLSGGIDSAVVTYLAILAVGKERVLPLYMPARWNFKEKDLVKEFVDHLDVQSYCIEIDKMVNMYGYLGLVQCSGQSREDAVRKGNLASRIRAAVLYDTQRSTRGRVLGTQNRSEYCQGYGTKFGTPESYDMGVLNKLYKVDIYAIAALLKIPTNIIAAPPTSGFWPGQTHEEELGATMQEQDVISYLLFEKYRSTRNKVDIVSKKYKINKAFVETMQKRWEVSQHKRAIVDAMLQVKLPEPSEDWKRQNQIMAHQKQ